METVDESITVAKRSIIQLNDAMRQVASSRLHDMVGCRLCTLKCFD